MQREESPLPDDVLRFRPGGGPRAEFAILCGVFLFMVIAIIYVEQGQRRIPIQFAKRVRGRRVMGGQATYIPLKVNMAGVIPVIFATSIMYFPALLASALPSTGWGASVRDWIDQNMLSTSGAGFSPSLWYIFILAVLVVFFTYFYTAIQFDPERQADMIQRQGGFIPGIRPGKRTAEYIDMILSRITFVGAVYVSAICVVPVLLSTRAGRSAMVELHGLAVFHQDGHHRAAGFRLYLVEHLHRLDDAQRVALVDTIANLDVRRRTG